jgi:hypothetical protein
MMSFFKSGASRKGAKLAEGGSEANPNYSFHDRAMKRPFLPERTCKARSTLRVRVVGDFSQENSGGFLSGG